MQETVPETQEPSGVVKKPAAVDESLLYVAASACKITGTQSKHAAARLLTEASRALTLWAQKDHDARLIDGAAMVEEIAPRNATEAMLAIQMVAIHEAGLRFLMHATKEGQDLDAASTSILQATRLTRVFIEQLEAMQKLKGKTGQQKVIVEHVHVHQGGQAIVGAVAATRTRGRECGGNGENNGNTP